MVTFKDVAEAYDYYKTAEQVYKNLSAQMIEEMQKQGIKKEETEYGKFTISQRTTYQFSPAVTALEEKVKLAKAKEINNGKAKQVQGSVSLRVTLPKVE